MLQYRQKSRPLHFFFYWLSLFLFIILAGMFYIESKLIWKIKEALVTQKYRLKVIKKAGQITAECNY